MIVIITPITVAAVLTAASANITVLYVTIISPPFGVAAQLSICCCIALLDNFNYIIHVIYCIYFYPLYH